MTEKEQQQVRITIDKYLRAKNVADTLRAEVEEAVGGVNVDQEKFLIVGKLGYLTKEYRTVKTVNTSRFVDALKGNVMLKTLGIRHNMVEKAGALIDMLGMTIPQKIAQMLLGKHVVRVLDVAAADTPTITIARHRKEKTETKSKPRRRRAA